MGKILKGIDGERFPLIGGVTEYRITFSEAVDVNTVNDNDILWQVYWANEYSEYEKVPFSGQKKGRLTTYKFLQNLQGKNLQLKATYKDETVELHITPQANGEIKIIDVFFLDVEYKIQDTSKLKYMNSVNLQIYTLNMLGKYVEFKMYDTVNGQDVEVAKNSEPMQVIQKNGIVKTKKAILLNPAMYMQTQKDMSASEHRYKVKVWERNNEANFYEEELKVKNEIGQPSIPQDSQAPQKTGLPEAPKKKEDEKEKKKEKCFCDKELEIEDFITLGVSKNKAKVYADVLNDTMKKYEINTCIRKSHFLAQIFHESGYLIFLSEQKSKHASSGSPYKGRGIMQITGESNYRRYGKNVTEDFTSTETNREKMALPPHNVKSAGWFWKEEKGLNSMADKNDFICITNLINGGNVGFNDRYKKLKICFDNIYKTCKNYSEKVTLNYTFENSNSYKISRFAFAWGLWHDKDAKKDGCTYNTAEAIKGYERLLDLLPSTSSDSNWYYIQENPVFNDIVIVDKKKNIKKVKIIDAATLRLKKLKK
ncbi:Predicted chitinase [Chryseobacterium ureilyticum]|uniref:Predicted chitinase n=1 Tax=Chryseobacterium ureilyticum TaxID=373668 RepID=A0A1N7PS17_9FLAO|nr:hypothetical protein [Chryseobacterium ureilyticum]SIT13443.1 Predicted chitinase [Chryseobacterium ureilyticum]